MGWFEDRIKVAGMVEVKRRYRVRPQCASAAACACACASEFDGSG